MIPLPEHPVDDQVWKALESALRALKDARFIGVAYGDVVAALALRDKDSA